MAQSIISSLAFRSLERFGVKGMGLVVGIVLARLLNPSDFGQIAIVMVFINLAQIFIDGGLNTALIQNARTTRQDYSTVFYTSLGISLILIAILHITAPYIADFYQSQALIAPLRVFSWSLLVGAFNSVLIAKMQREMRFKQLMYCNMIATLLSGVIGIYCAYQAMGVWALVIYFFSSTIIAAIMMSVAMRWVPQWHYSIGRAKELFSFGSKMMVSGLLCGLYHDLRTLIIGKLYTPSDLGYYNRGDQFPSVIANSLDNAVQSVMFPVMSVKQNDVEDVKDLLRKTLTMSSLFITPLMMVLAAMSEPVIRLLLTEKWMPCVPYMQWLCVGYASLSWSSSNLVALKSIGRSDLYMKLEMIRRMVMLVILGISVLCFDSLLAIAIGMVMSSWLDYAITTLPIGRLLHYGLCEQLKDIYKIVVASVVTALVVYSLTELCGTDWVMIPVQMLLALLVYWGLCWGLQIGAYKTLYARIVEMMQPKR